MTSQALCSQEAMGRKVTDQIVRASAAWFLTLAASGHTPIRIPAYTPSPPQPTSTLLAGVGKVDITPPPGYPMGGHSIGGQMARGYWTRLYARAFYFQSAGGHRLALISCDLFAIPACLHAEVVHDLGLPPEELILAATHTHHADPKMPALQLHQIPLLKLLQDILGSPQNYPKQIPVSVVTLGTLSLAAVPTEMTTVQGFHLRDALPHPNGQPYVIVGLANEYLGYTTTESEYEAQNYEGASTMYVKQQGEVLVKLLAGVASFHPPSPVPVPKVTFDAGGKWPYHFDPELFGERYNLTYQDLEPLIGDIEGRVDDTVPRFEWTEPSTADWNTAGRSVQILRLESGVWRKVDDDLGLKILTVLVDGRLNVRSADGTIDRRAWTAIWAPHPAFDPAPDYVFRITPPGKTPVCSIPFHPNQPVTAIPAKPLDVADCPPWREE